jgi:hypothetical protein
MRGSALPLFLQYSFTVWSSGKGTALPVHRETEVKQQEQLPEDFRSRSAKFWAYYEGMKLSSET